MTATATASMTATEEMSYPVATVSLNQDD
jgi:hypothetical protein